MGENEPNSEIKKFAFVVGIKQEQTKSTFNDGEDFSKLFETLGFTVFPKKNSGYPNLSAAGLLESFVGFVTERERFVNEKRKTFTVFIFSGKGARVGGKQYFLPFGVDAKEKKQGESECHKNGAISFDFFRSKLRGGRGHQVLYLLNCFREETSVFALDDEKLDISLRENSPLSSRGGGGCVHWKALLKKIKSSEESPRMVILSVAGGGGVNPNGESGKRNTFFSYSLMLAFCLFPYWLKPGHFQFLEILNLVRNGLGKPEFDGEFQVAGAFSILNEIEWRSKAEKWEEKISDFVRGRVRLNDGKTKMERSISAIDHSKRFAVYDQSGDHFVRRILKRKLSISVDRSKLKEHGVSSLSILAAVEKREVLEDLFPKIGHWRLISKFLEAITKTPRYVEFDSMKWWVDVIGFDQSYLRHLERYPSNLKAWLNSTEGGEGAIEILNRGKVMMRLKTGKGFNSVIWMFEHIRELYRRGLDVVGLEFDCLAFYFEFRDMPYLELRRRLYSTIVEWNKRSTHKVVGCDLYILKQFPKEEKGSSYHKIIDSKYKRPPKAETK